MRGGFQAADGLLVLARREGRPERNRERVRMQTCDAEREVAGFMAMSVRRWRRRGAFAGNFYQPQVFRALDHHASPGN